MWLRKRDNTEFQLTRLVQQWSNAMEWSQFVGVIFLDIKNGFWSGQNCFISWNQQGFVEVPCTVAVVQELSSDVERVPADNHWPVDFFSWTFTCRCSTRYDLEPSSVFAVHEWYYCFHQRWCESFCRWHVSLYCAGLCAERKQSKGNESLSCLLGNLRETTKNSKTLRSRKPSVKKQDPRTDLRMIFSRQTNGVYSFKWRLTDRYLRWGTLADPRPGRGHGDKCKSSEFLRELRISGFPRFWEHVHHLLSREIMMNRRHCSERAFYYFSWSGARASSCGPALLRSLWHE